MDSTALRPRSSRHPSCRRFKRSRKESQTPSSHCSCAAVIYRPPPRHQREQLEVEPALLPRRTPGRGAVQQPGPARTHDETPRPPQSEEGRAGLGLRRSRPGTASPRRGREIRSPFRGAGPHDHPAISVLTLVAGRWDACCWSAARSPLIDRELPAGLGGDPAGQVRARRAGGRHPPLAGVLVGVLPVVLRRHRDQRPIRAKVVGISLASLRIPARSPNWRGASFVPCCIPPDKGFQVLPGRGASSAP